MQLIIQETKDIPLDILNQIKQFSPRDGLKEQLWIDNPTDTRVQCAWENYAGYILDGNNLVSFAILAQDNKFNKNIAQAMWYNESNTATMIYLFTTPIYQKKWYAKNIIDSLFSFAKEHFMWCERLIRTTSSAYNKNLYIRYWATCTTIQSNTFLAQEWMENDSYFTYDIDLSTQA